MLLLEHAQLGKGCQHDALDVNLSTLYRKALGIYTPLQIAVVLQRTEIVSLLLHHNDIDVNKRDNTTGQSALDIIINPPGGFKRPDTEAADYIKKLLIAHGAMVTVPIAEQNYGERVQAIMAGDPQHVNTSWSPAAGVQIAGASCEDLEGDDHATFTLDDLMEYEHDFGIDNVIFDEWMDFDDFDMDQHNNTSIPGAEGYDYPLSAMDDLPVLESRDSTYCSSGVRNRPWEF
ncbi:hypothetical protein Ptr902_07387 [Pyrenophora tritici-repentis]|nr:hypothetical protein Ptr902_07387 [Pyrenophora tritici-repentis]